MLIYIVFPDAFFETARHHHVETDVHLRIYAHYAVPLGLLVNIIPLVLANLTKIFEISLFLMFLFLFLHDFAIASRQIIIYLWSC
ncbi:hypothetical protein BDP27DRAFT_1317750 [Rhodocollybia butyracea]|uniref:Uncharacterized protein n=1 Tax=Rhodocollybia butyracea TaxID=206335 RepID=A0A9P5Q4K6_9AGAR|nr:hypothetical protein BDP27DRAFT_1317750 [Rhodocollybia butyracea]